MEILETLLDIGIDMLDGFALLYLCRSMLKECRIKRAAVYYLFVLPIAAVIFAFNHYFPTVGGMVVTLLFIAYCGSAWRRCCRLPSTLR